MEFTVAIAGEIDRNRNGQAANSEVVLLVSNRSIFLETDRVPALPSDCQYRLAYSPQFFMPFAETLEIVWVYRTDETLRG